MLREAPFPFPTKEQEYTARQELDRHFQGALKDKGLRALWYYLPHMKHMKAYRFATTEELNNFCREKGIRFNEEGKITAGVIDLMEHARAAHAFVSGGSEQEQMWAFLSVFHPEMSTQEKRELTRDLPTHR